MNELYRYRYNSLPVSGWFRVLVIEPSDDPENSMSCKLRHYPISAGIGYDALSYTWGDEEPECQIFIDEKIFWIRKNLYTALQVIRRKENELLLWVDAICINQDDEIERDYQVRQMNDIFAKARLVRVWLGAATLGSDRGVDVLCKFHNSVHDAWKGSWARIGSTLRKKDRLDASKSYDYFINSREDYEAYYKPIMPLLEDSQSLADLDEAVLLLCRPWWKRMWTLQESVLCKQVVCYCGSKSFPLDYFYTLAYFIYFSANFDSWPGLLTDSKVSLRETWRIADLRDHFSKKGRISLLLALDSSWNRKASDAKDKVIGLLGLLGQRSDLLPEYAWPLEKVYRAAFRAAIQEEGDLACLGFMSELSERRNTNLPTWVPDLEIHSETGSDYLASLSKPIFGSNLYNASLAQKAKEIRISTEDDDSVLVLEGITISTVQDVGVEAPGWETYGTDETDNRKWKETIRETLQQWRAMMPIVPEKPYCTGESLAQVFWRTVLVDLKQGTYPKPSPATGPSRLDANDQEWLSRLETEEGLQELILTWELSCQQVFRQLRLIEQFHRRFFVTTNGYVGLGPPSLETGDSICVLAPGTVAYALRDSKNGRWKYVGECYLHGIMNGEIIENAAQNEDSYTTFRIE
ncbi:HET-domain-containing protein [Hypoxylon sp. NC0597]|nr:HET-domain-containing protein [Hypoxylon sp. NC0597]